VSAVLRNFPDDRKVNLERAWADAEDWTKCSLGSWVPEPLKSLEPVMLCRHWGLMSAGRYDEANQLRDDWADVVGAFAGQADTISELQQTVEDLQSTART
jgi:hypothetical protein